MTRLLTPKEVAATLNMSEAWVRKHAETLEGIRVGKVWRFPVDRITHIARYGTIPACPPPAYQALALPNAPRDQADGPSDGANMAEVASSAGTIRSKPRKTALRKSGGAFARDFPALANR